MRGIVLEGRSTLRDLGLDFSYRSDSYDLVNDFYVPCMSSSVLYCRAVGYFTSRSLALAARGVAKLLNNAGHIRLVASPRLDENDIEAIRSGYQSRDQVLATAVSRSFRDVEESWITDRLSALSWMIAEGRLDVKLAVRVNDGRLYSGIYHEKLGIFTDAQSEHVVFVGSSNETEGGLANNFESIDVFVSWLDPQKRVERKLAAFEQLWRGITDGLDVIEFTEASEEILQPYRSTVKPTCDPDERKCPGGNSIPTLYEHQQRAVDGWLAANGRGIFKMATGSGKTIAALSAVKRVLDAGRVSHVVIVVPYSPLVIQWADVCDLFGLSPILAFESRKRWFDDLSDQHYSVQTGSNPHLVVVTTAKTFGGDLFQSMLHDFPANTLIIADEVHNLGAPHLSKCLPENIRYRLGLSATPERWFDERGTETLTNYFGDTIPPEYSLKEALEAKVLVPYYYHPVLVELDEVEREEYLDLSDSISKLSRMSTDDEDDEHSQLVKNLLIKRSRIVASASNKLPALRDLMSDHRDSKRMLFFCGDGSVGDSAETSIRQVEAVTSLLGRELGIRVAKFLYDTSSENRQEILRQLDDGTLQGLVAIRCLDEGIDVPSIQKAFILASSSNPRQFVQRRGRILRRSAGKKSAEIFDFVVVPPSDGTISGADRSLLKRELQRYFEFANLARNAGTATLRILSLQKRFDLLDVH